MLAENEIYDDDAKLRAMIHRNHESAKAALETMRKTRWRRAYLYMHGVHDLSIFGQTVTEYPYESQVFIPTLFQQIMGGAPRVAAGVLANDPIAKVTAVIADHEFTHRTRYEQYAKEVGAFINQQLHTDIGIRGQLPMWIIDGELYGAAPLRVEWRTRSGLVYARRENAPGEWTFGRGQQEELKEDRISVREISPWNILPDPWGRSINGEWNQRECRFVQEDIIISVDELWAWIRGTPARGWKIKEGKKGKDELEKHMGRIKPDDEFERVMQAEVGELAPDQGETWRPEEEDKRMIKLIDHWENDRHVLIAGEASDGLVLLNEDAEHHPCPAIGKPFVFIRPLWKSGRLFGWSTSEVVDHLVEQVNTLVNLRNVNIARRVNGLTFVNNLSGLTADDILSQPGQVFDVSGAIPLDQIVNMQEFPDLGSDIYTEAQFALNQIERTGGQSDMSQGQFGAGPSHQTARGIGFVLEQGNARNNLKVLFVGEDLGNLVRMIHKMDQQYINQASVARLVGDDGATRLVAVLPKMIARNFEFKIDTRPVAANPAIYQQQLTNALSIVAQWPELNRQEAIFEIFKAFNLPDPRRFLATQSSDADAENMKFRAVGRFDSVRASDNHEHHIQRHQEVILDGSDKQFGPMGTLNARQHLQDHLAYRGMIRPRVGAGPAQTPSQRPMGPGGAEGGGPAAPPANPTEGQAGPSLPGMPNPESVDVI